ncbi:MAG TPA: hypothetical protein DDY98_09015 [Ruminococcaceae bacterium]|nr:hypothetical protein [Oscillospiraceae bacterium]
MAAYQNNAAYDFSMFEPAKKRPKAQAPARPKIVATNRKTPQQYAEEQKAIRLKVLEFAIVAVLCATAIVPNIFSRVHVNELNGQIATMSKQLNEMKSENTRLNMELKSKISVANVQNYAENVLGMVKRDRYQVYYFDLENGNEILPVQ